VLDEYTFLTRAGSGDILPRSMFAKRNVWVDLAVNRRAWHPKTVEDRRTAHLRWRVFIGRRMAPVYVAAVVVEGRAHKGNHRSVTFDVPDQRDVVACIRYFCNVEIRDGVAHLRLLNPPKR
jgi:hypothetical protein